VARGKEDAGTLSPDSTTGRAPRQPVVVSVLSGAASAEILLLRLNPTFRAHPVHACRLLADIISSGLD
jgi:hypothetical protein